MQDSVSGRRRFNADPPQPPCQKTVNTVNMFFILLYYIDPCSETVSFSVTRIVGVCVCGFTEAPLCTVSMVYGGTLVHHHAAICTIEARCTPWCTRETIFLSPPVHCQRQVKFFCLCVCGFTQAPLCTTTMVYGAMCTIWLRYAPPRCNVHHGAQGRLYFLENSGCPDEFLYL